MMNIHLKLLNKMLENIWTYIKKIIHHDQVGFIPEMQWCFKISKSIINRINELKDRNKMIITINAEQALKYIAFINDGRSRQCRARRNMAQHNTSHFPNVKKLDTSKRKQGMRKGCSLYHFFFMLCLMP